MHSTKLLVPFLRFKLLLLLLAIGLLAQAQASPALVQAQGVPPHIIMGVVRVDGGSVADGTRVIAWSGTEQAASTRVSGGRYLLQVPQPTGPRQLTFTVDTFVSTQTVPWEIGGANVLNLNASSEVSLLSLALEPLGNNLTRVFYFDRGTESWQFYDPRPRFNNTSSLTRLVAGEPYWLEVNRSQTVTLNGQVRRLDLGGNPLVW